MRPSDVSPDWKGSSKKEKKIIEFLIGLQETPEAITAFAFYAQNLSDYWYWFTLSTLWVSYTGFSDLSLWRRLFSSTRRNRATSLMKPSELQALKEMPETLTCYRAHRPGETDWIAYTLDLQIAKRFARERGVDAIAVYHIAKKDVLALFTRRGEQEILCLDRAAAKRVTVLRAVDEPAMRLQVGGL